MEYDTQVSDSDLDREAEKIVKDIGIPPCPAILTKVMREMRSDDPDFNKLGNLIGGDVSLAAAMLKTVNSPFYGLRTKVASIRQAIVMLGLRNVAQLVTGLLLRDAFPGGSSEKMEAFWESTAVIAQINAGLAGHFKGIDQAEAYTFALFRDCGMLAMISGFDGYEPILPGTRLDGGASVTQYEDKCYGMDHARVGCQLAKTWLLPEEICQAVLHHHDYPHLLDGTAGITAASARHIALALTAEELFVKQTTGESGTEWALGGAFALGQLGITAEELDSVAAEVISSELSAA
jgi:HD-like signal output (HDOD) protein